MLDEAKWETELDKDLMHLYHDMVTVKPEEK